MSSSLVKRFQDYSVWRTNVANRIQDYRRWLEENDFADAQTEMRLGQLLERLGEDKLTIAFVAEFSRGKSELINAIFFADYGRRLLPSSAGRTTMCPTELQWDPELPPCVQFLPIETRAGTTPTSEYRKFPDEWLNVPLNVSEAQSLVDAFQRVRDVKRVSLAEAREYGLHKQEDPIRGPAADGMVDIPRWRHALINFPHPLLEQGLVILDTPGLNALGTEPELTLNLLPNAYALLFILAVDTGLSRSDAAIWRDHIAAASGHHAGRFVVLNKIDTLWDGLRSEEEIAAEIDGQTAYISEALGIDRDRILPVSAQKGLVAKITDDEDLLARSRLDELEATLSGQLIPGRQEIMRESVKGELLDLLGNTRAILEARLGGVLEQLAELRALRGRNLDVVDQMMKKVRVEKEGFERGLARFQALRGVFSHHTNTLFSHLGMDALGEQAKRSLKEMTDSRLTRGLRAAMLNYFAGVRRQMELGAETITEIHRMMEAMYKRFAEEHGLRLSTPPPFSLFKYMKELDRLERNFRTHFDTALNMIATEQLTLTRRFFETRAAQVRRVYSLANREVEHWLKAVMAPMSTQVAEHQGLLRRRLESIKLIHRATDTLEDRVQELEQLEAAIVRQLEGVHRMASGLERVLALDDQPIAVAA